MTSDLAVFTVVYPAAMPFLPDLLAGLAGQDDDRFTLIVALDLVDPEHFATLAGGFDLPEMEIHAVSGTPLEIRNEVLLGVCRRFSAVVLQDADDVPRSARVATQRAALGEADVTASALALVDVRGRALHRNLQVPRRAVEEFLPRMNIFGFGNSAYRSEVLAECLPAPASVRAMDWYVATRAHLSGATLLTSDAVVADYRQHDASAAPVLPPLTIAEVNHGLRVSLDHVASIAREAGPEASAWVAPRFDELQRFERWIRRDERHGLSYLEALNAREDRVFAWWEYVAAESLEDMWWRA